VSFAAQPGLPRTRGFHRRRPMRLWWGAIVVALVANLGVVVALGQVSRIGHPAPTPPLALHRLRQIDSAPPPPPLQHPRETTEAHADAVVPLALPSLDLPATSVSALCLPAIGTPDATPALPIVIPPFTAIGPAVDAPATPATGLAIGPPAFEAAAQREGSFDLDRYYPRAARSRGLTGTTRIRSHIDSAGRVVAVEVLESQPSGVFEQAAERLGKAQRYRPAQKAGQSVPTIQDTTISWTIR
jgi:protein TonB